MDNINRNKAHTPNSIYKKLAVQWLNEALCPSADGFCGGRQFSASIPKASGTPTSCSRKTIEIDTQLIIF